MRVSAASYDLLRYTLMETWAHRVISLLPSVSVAKELRLQARFMSTPY
jgi:hypothetical protein